VALVLRLFALTILGSRHHFLIYTIFGLVLFGLMQPILLTPAYSIISYGNILSYICLFHLRPLFQENNHVAKQGLSVYVYVCIHYIYIYIYIYLFIYFYISSASFLDSGATMYFQAGWNQIRWTLQS
jgi:hypothetical protein